MNRSRVAVKIARGVPWAALALVAACSGGGTPARSTAPAATFPQLKADCGIGYEAMDSSYNWSGFIGGHAPVAIGNSPGDVAPAYQITFTNVGHMTAEVEGFAVVFSDGSGAEVGSDSERTAPTFILAGQSLTWTEPSGVDVSGQTTFSGNTGVVPATATDCQLVHWYHP